MCIACERTKQDLQVLNIPFNKEHLSPQWLVKLTGTDKTFVAWMGKRIPGLSVTIPLCKDCNSVFGTEIEKPTIQIFNDLESGKGITDYQAEILIRWMWKFEGMHWHLFNKAGSYSDKYTLRKRVLQDLDAIRPYLTLAVARLSSIDASHGDKPMGIDSRNLVSAIFVSGVFSELAIIVSLRIFDDFIPRKFSIYHLDKNSNNKKKVFFPDTNFEDDNEAVWVTATISPLLSRLHDEYQLEYQKKHDNIEPFIDSWLRKNK